MAIGDFLGQTEQLGHYAGKNDDVGTNHLQSFPNAEFTDLKQKARRQEVESF